MLSGDEMNCETEHELLNLCKDLRIREQQYAAVLQEELSEALEKVFQAAFEARLAHQKECPACRDLRR